MAGIDEVARQAGVSVSTASRAINGHPKISSSTVERVRQAAEDLGYVRSSSAYTLATGQNRNIGVLLPYVDRWYFSTILAGVEGQLIESGFDLTLYNLNGGPNQRKAIFQEFLLRKRVDALLTIALKLTPKELGTLERLGKPVVAIGGPFEGTPTVGIDDFGAARLATQHLITLGHERIAFIGADAQNEGDFYHPSIRHRGYLDAMAAAEIAVDDRWFATADFTIPGGYAAAQRLLTDPRIGCTGIVAASDEMAFGAMFAARDLGFRVPDDLSIIGIDGHDLSSFFGLTTIDQEPRAQGARAARLVLDLVNGVPLGVDYDEKWPLTLEPRSSTARRAV
jgi:DNA-binding LacI/PurR family transcriptional regulator